MGLFTDDGTLGKGGVLRTGEHHRETERLALRLTVTDGISALEIVRFTGEPIGDDSETPRHFKLVWRRHEKAWLLAFERGEWEFEILSATRPDPSLS